MGARRGPAYDTNPPPASGLLASLDPSVLPLIVNWAFPAPAPTPSSPVTAVPAAPTAPAAEPRFTG